MLTRVPRKLLPQFANIQTTKYALNHIATVIKAPQKTMVQLGSVLKQIIYKMGTNFDPSQPFMYSKADIKDGFWRLMVSSENAWHFCYVLLPLQGTVHLDDMEIVVPHVLQMGWCESPPLFCTATETARDVIQTLATKISSPLPPHPLEHYMLPEQLQESKHAHNPSSEVEVYVDDFIAITNDLSEENLTKLSRAILHGIHSVFPPPTVTGHEGGDPVSIKKLQK